MAASPRVHGGPDAASAARHDFSTNANACGPCPLALAAVHAADAARSPDPASTRLRALLAQFHGLWSPNKALGLTGVRAAYAIAPLDSGAQVEALEALAPSWPLGAHGVALLEAWCAAPVQQWLADSRAVLREWKARQEALWRDLGWKVHPGSANFFVVQSAVLVAALPALRERGIQLRDCTSFGLPGHARLAVLAPAAQDALAQEWRASR
jgi:histidinol-phosphate aminotransferase